MTAEFTLIAAYADYQSGDTIPTPDGDRIAGEVRLIKNIEILGSRMGMDFELWKYIKQFPDLVPDDYLCIAESRPVSLTPIQKERRRLIIKRPVK